MTTPYTPRKPTTAFYAFAIICLLAVDLIMLDAFSGCAPITPAAQTVIDLGQAVCTLLGQDLQDEPGWLKFACTLIGADGKSKTVIVKVPKASLNMPTPPYGSTTPICR